MIQPIGNVQTSQMQTRNPSVWLGLYKRQSANDPFAAPFFGMPMLMIDIVLFNGVFLGAFVSTVYLFFATPRTGKRQDESMC